MDATPKVEPYPLSRITQTVTHPSHRKIDTVGTLIYGHGEF